MCFLRSSLSHTFKLNTHLQGNMSKKYPLSSLARNRFCGHPRHIWGLCPEFPCKHTPCHDPDYLADVEDFLADRQYHSTLWACFRSLSDPSGSLRNTMSPEEWARYAFNFDRCCKLEPKLGRIRKEIDAFWRKHVQNIEKYQTFAERVKESLIKDICFEARGMPPAELRSDVPMKYFDGAGSWFLY